MISRLLGVFCGDPGLEKLTLFAVLCGDSGLEKLILPAVYYVVIQGLEKLIFPAVLYVVIHGWRSLHCSLSYVGIQGLRCLTARCVMWGPRLEKFSFARCAMC